MERFLLQILFIIIPGLIGIKLYKTLRNIGPAQKKLKDWQDFIEIFLFSIGSYFLYGFLNNLLHNFPEISLKIKMFNLFFKDEFSYDDLEVSEIFFSSLLSIILAIIGAAISNKKILFKIAERLKITKHYGDEDVWSNFLYEQKSDTYYFLRDHKLLLIYFAKISKFSDSGEDRELVLEDVSVYNNKKDCELLYTSDKLYISRNKDDISIELPDLSGNDNNLEDKNGKKKIRRGKSK